MLLVVLRRRRRRRGRRRRGRRRRRRGRRRGGEGRGGGVENEWEDEGMEEGRERRAGWNAQNMYSHTKAYAMYMYSTCIMQYMKLQSDIGHFPHICGTSP